MITQMKTDGIDLKFLGLLCLSIALLINLPSTYSGFASAQNNTLMQPDGIQGKSANATNIVLVHGTAVDGSSGTR